MTEPNRSFWIGSYASSWDDAPRWQRLGFFWAAILLVIALAVKSGARESWLIMVLSLLAGRLLPTLFDLKAGTRKSDPPTSILGDR